ncbi:MAG TPA: ABC transporter permease [Dehalococcoidia bacterium]|nr:ABC transporter permease [Dehalococcoidia bacterium]
MAGQQAQDAFGLEELEFRQPSLPMRVLGSVGSFIHKKKLGAFGLFVVFLWGVFALGTLGNGGGWLGIGRYDHLRVFRVASTDFANAKVADALEGQPADIDQAGLAALLSDPAEYLGSLAVAQEVDEELHEYVQLGIADGSLLSLLVEGSGIRDSVLRVEAGVFVRINDLFATGTATPLRTDSLADPSGKHWFGTDRAGQDIFARIAEGSRLSLQVGIFAAAISVGAGVIIGLSAGYLGGWFDILSQRIMDAMQAFPPLIFLLLLASVTRGSLTITILALGFIGIADSTRIIRGSVIATRQAQYVEAAQTIGAGGFRIAARHILPNIMAPIIVFYTIAIGAFILAEAALSFLGLGPIQVSWGKMVSDGRQFIISGSSPWLSLWAGLAITTLVFGFNVAGDAFRDVLDPRLRGSQ